MRMISRKPAIGAALAATALAAALVPMAPATAGGPPASAAPAATASKSEVVRIRNFEYSPATIRISRGDRVVWANLDDVKHTATSRGRFSTGKIRSGKAIAIKFRSKGRFPYHCTIHPEMRGKVVVG